MRIVLAVLATGAATIAAILLFRTEAVPAAVHPHTLSVTIAVPQHGHRTEWVTAVAATVPREEIQLMSEVSGVVVREVRVEAGERVAKGDVLAVLDDASLTNKAAQLRSDYERAQDAFERVDKLKSSGSVSRQMVTERRLLMEAAKAALNDAELNVRRTAVVAPEGGLVIERRAVVGRVADDGEPLFRIAHHGEIEFEAMVPEAALTGLAIGQQVEISPSGGAAIVRGNVRIISPRVDGASRMVAVRIAVEEAQPAVVGLFATARIALRTLSGFLLPRTAVQHDEDGAFVWRVDGESRARRLAVDIVLTEDDEVLLRDVPSDALVIAKAGAFVKEGDTVRISEGGS